MCFSYLLLCLWLILFKHLKLFNDISVRVLKGMCLDKFWNGQALLVYMNDIEKMWEGKDKTYRDCLIRPFPGIRVQGHWSWCCLLLWATILSTIFIKGMQIDRKRQEPGAVAECAGGHLHAQVQRQTLMLSPPLSLSLFQRSLSPTTQHWTPSGTNTVSSLSVLRLPTSACDTNLRPTSWSVCVLLCVVTAFRVSLKNIKMYVKFVKENKLQYVCWGYNLGICLIMIKYFSSNSFSEKLNIKLLLIVLIFIVF